MPLTGPELNRAIRKSVGTFLGLLKDKKGKKEQRHSTVYSTFKAQLVYFIAVIKKVDDCGNSRKNVHQQKVHMAVVVSCCPGCGCSRSGDELGSRECLRVPFSGHPQHKWGYKPDSNRK